MARWIEYQEGGQPLKGYFASSANNDKVPGVLIFHAWLGVSDSIQERANRIAALGYTAFAADIFGKPTVIEDGPRKMVTPFMMDRAYMRRRAQAGLAALLAQPECDGRVIAIGYCFGGCVALELARDKADLLGVVSFHGELDTPVNAKAGDIRAKLLVLTGDDDPVIPFSRIAVFRDEMRGAKANFEISIYSGAKHSFTGEGSLGPEKTPEAVLNPQAEARSWQSMVNLFAEIFGPNQF